MTAPRRVEIGTRVLRTPGRWKIIPVGSRDWLAEWSRFARLLADVETDQARAALVDTNGDGRELWFGLDVPDPSQGWSMVLDWDDVDSDHPVERVPDPDSDLAVGWGTGRPRQRETVDRGETGDTFPVGVGRDGWWIVVVDVATNPTTPPKMLYQPLTVHTPTE